MSNLLLTLGLGVGLSILAFALIYRLTRLGGKEVALMVGLAVLGVYVPFGVLFWPGADVFALHIALFAVTPYGLGIVTSRRESHSQEERKGGWFHWAPATIVVFFIFIAIVDAVIISLADRGLSGSWAAKLLPEPRSGGQVSSLFPGTVYHDFQEKEQLYNEYLERLRRQQERGWQVRRGWLETPMLGKEKEFQVEVRDREGKPVESATVTAEFLRPSDHREDLEVHLREISPGRYRADLALPLPGLWEVLIQIRRGEELHEIRGTTSVREAPVS